jgi:hypothetical protein
LFSPIALIAIVFFAQEHGSGWQTVPLAELRWRIALYIMKEGGVLAVMPIVNWSFKE